MSRHITSVALSDDATCFAVSHDNSFQVFSSDSVNRKFQKDFSNMKLTKLATNSDGSFVAFGSIMIDDSPNNYKVFLWNNFYGECHTQLEFSEEIISLILRPQIMLIVFANLVVVYDVQNKVIIHEKPTAQNNCGVADISYVDGKTLIAYCSDKVGYATIFDPFNDEKVPISFQAAKHNLSIFKFSPDGSLIAIASERGTLIRIFDCNSGIALSAFRRGSLPSQIMAMSFSPSNSFLLAISSSGTIHLFNAEIRNSGQSEPQRALSKLKINSSKDVQSMFISSSEVYIIDSNGYFSKIKYISNNFEVINKTQIYDE